MRSSAPAIQNTIEPLRDAAQRAVNALMKIGPAGTHAAALTAATEAIEALRTQARAPLFGAVLPVGADVWADFERYSTTFSRTAIDAQVADLHAAAIECHPQLATALRSRAGMLLVEDALRGVGIDPAARLRILEERIATDLTAAGAGAREAEILSIDVPAFDQEIAAFRAAVAEHHRVEAERIAASRMAAERAEIERRASALQELRGWFTRHQGVLFMYSPTNAITDQAIALNGGKYADRALQTNGGRGNIPAFQLKKAVAARRHVDREYTWPIPADLNDAGDGDRGLPTVNWTPEQDRAEAMARVHQVIESHKTENARYAALPDQVED